MAPERDDTRAAHDESKDSKVQKAKPKIQAPWPDDNARQQMSQANAQEGLGKHSKNPDWRKQW